MNKMNIKNDYVQQYSCNKKYIDSKEEFLCQQELNLRQL